MIRLKNASECRAFVLTDKIPPDRIVFLQPLPTEGDPEYLPAATLIKAKSMAVLYQLVLFVIYSVAELGFQKYERLLLKFFVFLFHKAWIELIPIVLLAVFEPPSLLVLLEIV